MDNIQGNEIQLNENTKAPVDTEGVAVETIPLETPLLYTPTMKELVTKAQSGKFMEFTFPMMCSGLDPDNPDETLIKMVYPTIQFSKPASPRNVRKHIIKLIKHRYKRQITSEQSKKMFELGVEHMYQIREMAQGAMDSLDQNEGAVLDLIASAQAKVEKALDENPELERV